MHRPAQTLIATGAALLAVLGTAASPATAHELQVLRPGSAEIDLGSADPARLVHATLVAAGDVLVVTVTPGTAPVEVTLLVPDRTPESGYDAAALPTLAGTWTGGGFDSASSGVTDSLVDDGTGIEYRAIGTVPIETGGATATITVGRGSKPVRIALRVGLPTTFSATDPERTPRAALDTRLWAETPPPGTEPDGPPAEADTIETRYAWYGAAIGVLGLLVAAWWILRGRAASRRSGAERAAAERSERDGRDRSAD